MRGQSYGYIRVSTIDQNDSRQRVALSRQGIEEDFIYVDKISGKDFHRPQYRALVRRLRPEDTLYITSIDRLGRNYEEIQRQWRLLTKNKKIDIVVLDMPLLDTRRDKDLLGTFIADLVLQVLSFVAHSERENIRQRQSEGIAAALARGVRFGRRAQPLPNNFAEILESWLAKKISAAEAARLCGMSRSSFLYRAKKRARTTAALIYSGTAKLI